MSEAVLSLLIRRSLHLGVADTAMLNWHDAQPFAAADVELMKVFGYPAGAPLDDEGLVGFTEVPLQANAQTRVDHFSPLLLKSRLSSWEAISTHEGNMSQMTCPLPAVPA
ncbi:hypothetical protein [Pseudorhodoferax sp. Leaf267]|uniref:hypothetical protein n=1 Tax=Pseudorhodoferax sp. Leaf267 TaxID=1736316 RepID=UPI0012E31B68|nr:hypothetical protein [Pseudorhodoferax sp. Leaf267]